MRSLLLKYIQGWIPYAAHNAKNYSAPMPRFVAVAATLLIASRVVQGPDNHVPRNHHYHQPLRTALATTLGYIQKTIPTTPA